MFLEILNLKKSYQLGETKVDALRGVTLEIKKGEFTGLIGTSGSGKSTFLNMIGCIDYPDSGSIKIEGQDITSLSEDSRSEFRNKRIGFIFQNFNLLPVLSVYENVELPLLVNDAVGAKERRARVLRAIKDVELENFANSLPDRLSGGQRQRVAIARALVSDPAFILADEPTANLDSRTAHSIIDLLLKLNEEKKVTFLFSSHDEKLISRVRRVLHINDGLIIDA
jgi:putative ABC transport system ATP-binding protein